MKKSAVFCLCWESEGICSILHVLGKWRNLQHFVCVGESEGICSILFVLGMWRNVQYCRMLNVREHLSWRFGFARRSRYLNLASVTSGVLFSYESIIFGEFYIGESKEPRETRVIKFSRKLSILQYFVCVGKMKESAVFCLCWEKDRICSILLVLGKLRNLQYFVCVGSQMK